MIQHKCSSYCPPNCPFVINYCNHPIQCDDYDCTNPKTCVQMIASDCVIYEGTTLQQYGVQSGQNATDIIIQLVNLVYPSCASTTTTSTSTTTTTSTTSTTTTTTTICQRPQGLTTFSFFSSIEVGGVPPSFNFTATLIDACQALNDSINIIGTTLGGQLVQALSLTVGNTIYSGLTGTDCTVMPDGYYLCFDITNTEIYHVVGGVLTQILTCP